MRLRCRIGRHVWGPWQKPEHQVLVARIVNADENPGTFIRSVLGYEYTPCEAPSCRRCLHCPAMEMKDER